jgi:hypothetical protein
MLMSRTAQHTPRAVLKHVYLVLPLTGSQHLYNSIEANDSRPFYLGRKHMSSKVGQDGNYVAHRVEVAISSRESETRIRKFKQLAVLGCAIGFLLAVAFIVL